MVPFAALQGSAFAGIGTGFGLSRDIENGFYDRLLLAPGGRAGLLLGPAMSSVVRSSITVVLVMALGLALGIDTPGGPLSLVLIWFAACALSVVSTGFAMSIVYLIRGPQAAPIMQLGIFITMFVSNGQVPTEVQVGWVKPIAEVNPLSKVLDLGRQGFIGDLSWGATWPGLIALAGTGALVYFFAFRNLRHLTP